MSPRLLQTDRLALVMFSVSFGLFAIYIAIGAISVTTDVSKSLVDADAALIGFLGVITVFIFNTYRDEARAVERRIEAMDNAYADFLKAVTSKPRGIEKIEPIIKAEETKFDTKKKVLEGRLGNLRQSSRESFYLTTISALGFFISILSALAAMTSSVDLERFIIGYTAVAATGIGVIALFMMIWKLKADLE